MGGGEAGDGGWKEGVEMELSEEDVMKRLKEGWYENGLKNIHTDIHTYIHTYIHTHTYTHTQTPLRLHLLEAHNDMSALQTLLRILQQGHKTAATVVMGGVVCKWWLGGGSHYEGKIA